MILGSGDDSLDDMLMDPPARTRGAGLPTAADQPPSPKEFIGFDINQPPDLSSLSLKKIKKKAIDHVEREVIVYVLEKTGWNRSKATKILNISYKTLLYKIRDLGIEPPDGSAE